MEHRCGQRRVRQEPVALTCGEALAVIAQCHDLSSSGAFLLTTLKPPPLAPIEVFFPKTQRAYHAHVVRITREGIGLEWEEFCPDLCAAEVHHSGAGRGTEPLRQAHPVLTTLQNRG